MSKEYVEDEVKDVFDDTLEKTTKKCPTCGGEMESDAQFCPYCGAQIGESVKVVEKEEVVAPKVVHAPRPLKKGEKVEKSATPTQEYKYGDGYSVSALSLWTLYGCWLYPVISFIISMCGLSTKNPKDKKLFKISSVLSLIFLVIHIVVIILSIRGDINLG